MILINYIRNIKGLLANIYHMLTVFIYIKTKPNGKCVLKFMTTIT